MSNKVYFGDNLELLKSLPSESIDLVYIDPPFNTGKPQKRNFIKTISDVNGDRVGFSGKTYRTEVSSSASYTDKFDDFIEFIRPRITEIHRILKSSGSLYFHIDYREVHYCKVFLDTIFGRENFLNEIIWAYDYGARATKKWSAKHDNILLYVKDINKYYFDISEVDRIPYMAPGLVGEEKAARGKTPTDTWWHTIVSPTGKEKVGYPTQKPLGIINRIINVSCPKDGLVLDCFAGSGTTGASALINGRQFILADQNQEAIDIMKRRFSNMGQSENVEFRDL